MEKDFGFQNRPVIVANGKSCNGNDSLNHKIIITPVPAPRQDNIKENSSKPADVNGIDPGNIRSNRNKRARYAVNYR